MTTAAVDASAAADSARIRRDRKAAKQSAMNAEAEAAEVIAVIVPEISEEFDSMGVTVGSAEASASVEAVRAFSSEAVDAAWATWRDEFAVQLKIWESQSLFRNAHQKNQANKKGVVPKPPEEPPEAKIREAIELAVRGAASDPVATVAALAEAVAKDPDWEIIGGGTRNALAALVAATAKQQRCNRLVLRLELAGRGSPSEEADAEGVRSPSLSLDLESEDLETLLESCQLPRGKVEFCARRVLGLPLVRTSPATLS